jgi:hypothetical protein
MSQVLTTQPAGIWSVYFGKNKAYGLFPIPYGIIKSIGFYVQYNV